MNIICVPYGTDHQQAVRIGDTLRIFAQQPKDDNTWAGNVTFRTSISAAATDDVALAEYTGGKVRGQHWDLHKEYDTSSLTANTKYLVVAELTSGTKKVELWTTINTLPQGRS